MAPPFLSLLIDRATPGVEEILNHAVADRVFPGAAAAILLKGESRIVCRGRASYDESAEPIERANLFDLASLTKVVATATAIMQLHERGLLSLDDSAGCFLPEFAEGVRAEITIALLLSHRAGFPALAPYYELNGTAAELKQAALNWPLEREPGAERVYDDLSYVALGAIIERVSGQDLATYCREHIFAPLGMSTACFCPALAGRAAVPTEIDPRRGGLLQGRVHDENASALGGVAGHAGLFATIDDVARFLSFMLAQESKGEILSADGIRRLRSHQWRDAQGDYGLSWDRFRPSYMNGIDDPDAFGHTGFTGTSIVACPSTGLGLILLSNAVHPRRQGRERIDRIRCAFAKAVHETVEGP